MIQQGIYIETIVQEIGTGGTARRQEIKNTYRAVQISEAEVMIQLLDMDDKPLPLKENVPVADFVRRFKYQPDYFEKKKTPQQEKVDKAIAQAEVHAKRKEYFSAEFEYEKALNLDEENVRANFGIGKVYLATGEIEKARKTFSKLTGIDAVFEEKNKHIFNELGIELRRLKLYGQAIDYYRKALTIARDDEHLYFNIARAYFEKGDVVGSAKYLSHALKLNPALEEGRKLLAAIKQKKDMESKG